MADSEAVAAAKLTRASQLPARAEDMLRDRPCAMV